MKNSRIIVLATCCAVAARAWAGAGLTSAGVDPTVGNNNAQAEPTLAQVAPVANQGQPGGTSAGVVLPATGAGAQAGGTAGQHAANGAAGDASKSATPVVVAPTPPPPPPDPSTLPVSVIRPLNKAPEGAAPSAAESASSTSAAAKTRPTRQAPANAPAEPIVARPLPPPRVVPPAPARADVARAASDASSTPAAAASATADGSANGYVFYTGVGIAGIILALSFAGFMRAGNSDTGRPRA